MARASIQRPYNNQIMTPHKLFDWASTNVPAVQFSYCSIEADYKREQNNLEQHFHHSCTIPGTRKLHSFVSISNIKLRVSLYSASDTAKEERVTLGKNNFFTRIKCRLCHMLE